ncbi:Hypothetical_protein [Hexamita inflata]|uniref:Hypothetical_protein n=1 Tax=Hexamita inflata TaxID=28002 RepID=A0AA86VNM8_9EUKA|nr:Hypothetical protein HINF_LOCUS59193 [Hexamita inflata]
MQKYLINAFKPQQFYIQVQLLFINNHNNVTFGLKLKWNDLVTKSIQAVPKHAVSAVLGTRFSAAPHAAAVSAEPRFLAVFSWVFLVLAEKLHIPGFEPETKRMQHLNTTNQTKLSRQQNDFQLKLKILQIVMNSNKVET